MLTVETDAESVEVRLRSGGILCPQCSGVLGPWEPVPYTARQSRYSSDSLVITHPFHPLNGQRLAVLFTQHKRTGLYFVCEVDGRRRVTVAQEWTDRGVPASTDRLAVEGLTAARELVDAIDSAAAGEDAGETPAEKDGQRPGTGTDVGLDQQRGRDGGGEHDRIAAARKHQR